METWLSKPTLDVVCINSFHDCEWESRQLDQIVDPLEPQSSGHPQLPEELSTQGEENKPCVPSSHKLSF